MNAQLSIGTSAIRQFDNLYSLNDLHKAAGGEKKHQPNRFLRNEQTQALITELNHYPKLGSALKSINGGHNRGTFACKELVYAYAMWISPKFMLEVIRAYDNLVAPSAPLALPAPNLATSAQKLHLRRLVEARAKNIGGTRGDYSIVWRKVHDFCQIDKIDDLTPEAYLKACAFFNVQPLMGEAHHALQPDNCVSIDDTTLHNIQSLIGMSLNLCQYAEDWQLFRTAELLQSQPLLHIASVCHEFGFLANTTKSQLMKRMAQNHH